MCSVSKLHSFELQSAVDTFFIIYHEISIEGPCVTGEVFMSFGVTLWGETAALITLYQHMLMWNPIKHNVR